jgi:hypothetical protein
MNIHQITWRVFRRRYEVAAVAALPRLYQRLWQIAADELEQRATLIYLADVPATLPMFAAALRSGGMDASLVALYLGRIEHALDWAAEVGLLAGTLEKVDA